MIRLPRTKRGIALTISGTLLVVIVGGFLLVYFVVFPTSSPKPFSLSSANPSGSSAAAGTSATSSTAAGSVSKGTSFAGAWQIASGSEAGYRVREKLAFLPAESDAVGRTSQMSGHATFAQSGEVVRITAASFTVDVATLKSDRSMRDEKIHEIGLESSRYPNATFALSSPVVLPAQALTGKVVHVHVTGIFNIHGTSKTETLPLELSLSDSLVQAVGSLTFPWGEFNMTAPSVGGFVNVTEKATMEFDLHLQRA
jgi:polyisoprenoid-binding protein YceI